MKKILFVFIAMSMMSSICYDTYYEPYSEYSPVLMLRSELEQSISFAANRKMIEPGKIYIKGDTLYIVEKYQGIHVINNSDPKTPTKIGFITIPGCIDMAVKENVLFADNSVDLVAIRLSQSLSELIVTKRIRNVFPELTPPDNRELPSQYHVTARPENTIIVAWEKVSFQ